ncbi:hypothetical protein [Aurantiacibacter sp. MUD61]|uniref:hypothetical protein n=1 Tax=Aurantiacibacter sp. MUD61 TaxID=3009083 RepID=UPI0022F0A141|nr:hypothetical protein [Aurantiacibacter sp. MUD61]
MRIHWRSHWLWLVILLTALTAFDYVDHITRPGAPFGEQPMAWLGFTLGSHITLLVAAYVFAMLLRRLPLLGLLADTVGFASAISLHLKVSGPFWRELFWTGGDMQFASVWLPMVVGAAAYLIFRGIFHLVRRATIRDRLR